MFITCVTPKDYKGIVASFTAEEIKEKYQNLRIVSQEEYNKGDKSGKNKKIKN